MSSRRIRFRRTSATSLAAGAALIAAWNVLLIPGAAPVAVMHPGPPPVGPITPLVQTIAADTPYVAGIHVAGLGTRPQGPRGVLAG